MVDRTWACHGTLRNTNFYEIGLVSKTSSIGWSWKFMIGYRDALDVVDSEGNVTVPTGFELGAI